MTFFADPRVRLGGFVAAVVLSAIWPVGAQRSTSPQAALKIVVIAGEDAVNIVQQKTAVAPIVEVRDRNDQPRRVDLGQSEWSARGQTPAMNTVSIYGTVHVA